MDASRSLLTGRPFSTGGSWPSLIQVKHNEFAANDSLWTQPRVDPAPKRIDEPITLAIGFLDVYNAVLVLEGPLRNCFSRAHHSSRPTSYSICAT